MKNLYIIIILLLSYQSSIGQDARFSQYLSAPLLLNPALTGITDKDVRVVANYRTQWSFLENPYRTTALSVDARPVMFKNRDFFNVGLLVMNDRAGEINYSQNGAYLSLAYSKNFSSSPRRSHYLTLGFQGGYLSNRFDISKIEVVDPSQLAINVTRMDYLDVAVGGLWFYATQDFNVYLGVSAYHLNKPLLSLSTNSDETLYQRQSVHAGGEWKVGRALSLLPSALYQRQGEMQEIVVGTWLLLGENQRQEETALFIGGWYRVEDAFIISTRLDYQDFSFILSYDANTSTLVEASRGFGAVEVSVQYGINRNMQGRSGKNKYGSCPRF